MIDFDLAINGAELVISAYDQYTALLSGQKWNIPGLRTIIYARPSGIDSDYEPWGFVRSTNASVDVVFRGTKSFDDWLSNEELSAGWWGIYNQFGASVLDILMAYPGCKINVFGHSSGCALAKRLQFSAMIPMNLILFEPPRDTVRVACTSIINESDIVPKIPELPDYDQCGLLVKFYDNRDNPVANHSMENVLENLKKMKAAS